MAEPLFLKYSLKSDYSWFNTRTVNIGNIALGGKFPVRIQSMTNTATTDTRATVAQITELKEAGCELVRITTQGIREAGNLSEIKNELTKRSVDIPLIADVHFNPKIAEIAARFAEKVRINPGNYSDRKRGISSISETEYNAELDRIRSRIAPLVKICQQYGTVIRIGSNHGSLSERILLRYGNTPAGMVEATLEFVRIFEELGFKNLVLSMKSSNVKMMIDSTRLLVTNMAKEEMQYPLHLGVTEAGNGDEGRIKSAAGIGTLLEEGLGDTIRVSLTEDPVQEIPVAKQIVSKYNTFRFKINPDDIITIPKSISPKKQNSADVFDFRIGNKKFSKPVIFGFENSENYGAQEIKPDITISHKTDLENKNSSFIYLSKPLPELKFLQNDLSALANPVLIINTDSLEIQYIREYLSSINNLHIPVLLKRSYNQPDNEILINSPIDFSSLLTDKLIQGFCITSGIKPDRDYSKLAFGILQALELRFYKAVYIACPSCGRTSFDIETTLKTIQSATSHLKGLKIGVMGCIVNGPGEMADADYGYVGAGPGKISLYKGKL
ncbi:MAG: (E)-4-hydroxy-3-methylbut-2-enyl-diphosphate synthase, partial [Bacteroidales bacterium]|nr:(E)-4-hydroxy-3-methylbut-2-enyl-diphosphate synthase [Bacteroidales bacterium]